MSLFRSIIISTLTAGLALPSGAQEAPLSAIDWLSQPIADQSLRGGTPRPAEAATASGIDNFEITATPLDGPTVTPVGLIAADIAGFSNALWAETDQNELIRAIETLPALHSPAARELLFRLLIIRAPVGSSDQAAPTRARAEKLADLGAVEEAVALLLAEGLTTPENFDLFFDLSLLIEKEDIACARWATNRRLSARSEVKTFCLARAGQWDAAITTFYASEALGDFTPTMADLLASFLDPELADTLEIPSPDMRKLTPLEFRLRSAAGQPVPTLGLPLGFALSDLQKTVGWRAELEAAERLAREGVISATQLLEVYTRRSPAASGGVWERVDAVQELDHALGKLSSAEIGPLLLRAWDEMAAAGLANTLARLFGKKLSKLPLAEEFQSVQTRLALLSGTAPITPTFAIAASEIQAGSELTINHFKKIRPALLGTELFDGLSQAPIQDAAPLQLFDALRDIEAAYDGDFRGLSVALRILRGYGQTPLARSIAIEFLVLEAD